jgi:hypothetical protein
MAAANWPAVENALQGWVKAATGWDNRHVFWADPNVSRPTDAPFCTLEMLTRRSIGSRPAMVQTDHDDAAQGQEVELEAVAMLDVTFRVQVFVPPARATKPGTPRGASNAATIAERIRIAAALPSNIDRLDTAGVAVHDLGQVDYVPELVGTDFEGRAVLECRFYVADSVSEFTGYIAEVDITDDEDTERDITVDP